MRAIYNAHGRKSLILAVQLCKTAKAGKCVQTSKNRIMLKDGFKKNGAGLDYCRIKCFLNEIFHLFFGGENYF